MKNSVKFNLSFSTSKVLSYLIFISATILAFYLRDKQIFLEGTLYAVILQGTKTVSAAVNNKTLKKDTNDVG